MAAGLRILADWWGITERAMYRFFREEIKQRYNYTLERRAWVRIWRSRETPPIVIIKLIKSLTGLPADIWFPDERDEYFGGWAPPIEITKPRLVLEQIHAQNPWLKQGMEAWQAQVVAGIRPRYKIVTGRSNLSEE